MVQGWRLMPYGLITSGLPGNRLLSLPPSGCSRCHQNWASTAIWRENYELDLKFSPGGVFIYRSSHTDTDTLRTRETGIGQAIERWPGSTAVLWVMTHIRVHMLLQSTEARRWAASIMKQIMPPPTLFRLRWQETDQGQPSRVWFLSRTTTHTENEIYRRGVTLWL